MNELNRLQTIEKRAKAALLQAGAVLKQERGWYFGIVYLGKTASRALSRLPSLSKQIKDTTPSQPGEH